MCLGYSEIDINSYWLGVGAVAFSEEFLPQEESNRISSTAAIPQSLRFIVFLIFSDKSSLSRPYRESVKIFAMSSSRSGAQAFSRPSLTAT